MCSSTRGVELVLLCFFLFKQKTAYEMRISDWSSDVCSSDLPRLLEQRAPAGEGEIMPRKFVRSHARGALASAAVAALLTVSAGTAGAQDAKEFYDEIGRASCRERVCQYV